MQSTYFKHRSDMNFISWTSGNYSKMGLQTLKNIHDSVVSRLSIAHTLPRSKQRTCLWQLQHSLESAVFPTIETMKAWADLHQVVCLHDQRTIDTIWQHQFMDDNLKQQTRKALRPSLQFRVSLSKACEWSGSTHFHVWSQAMNLLEISNQNRLLPLCCTEWT